MRACASAYVVLFFRPAALVYKKVPINLLLCTLKIINFIGACLDKGDVKPTWCVLLESLMLYFINGGIST